MTTQKFERFYQVKSPSGTITPPSSTGDNTIIYMGITVADGATLVLNNNVLCIGDITVGAGATLTINGDCHCTGSVVNTTGETYINGNLHVDGAISQAGNGIFQVKGNVYADGGIGCDGEPDSFIISGNVEWTSGITLSSGVIEIKGDLFCGAPLVQPGAGLIVSGNTRIAGGFDNNGSFSSYSLDVEGSFTNLGELTLLGKLKCSDFIKNGNIYSGSMTNSVDPLVMLDSMANFVPNSLIGLTIDNETDGSSGIVTANDNNSVTCAAGLSGGLLNTWTSGDEFEVVIVSNFTSRDVDCGNSINNCGSMSINGDCKCISIFNESLGIGVFIQGDLIVKGSPIGGPSGGSIFNYGDMEIFGDVFASGNIVTDGIDLVIAGDCTAQNIESSGDAAIRGKLSCQLITCNDHNFTVGKDVICDTIENSSHNDFTVEGNCQVSSYISNYGNSRSGQHVGADDPNIMTDPNNDFPTDGSLLGLTIANGTDGSSGVITDNTSTTITCAGGLSGGSANTWHAADLYEVWIPGHMIIYGDCKVGQHVTNSSGSTLLINGKLNINGYYDDDEGYFDNSGGAVVNVSGECSISGRLTNTGGTFFIASKCSVFTDISNIFGNIGIAGDLILSGTDISNIFGNIEIAGDLILFGQILQSGNGMFIVGGNCKAAHLNNMGSGTIVILGNCQLYQDLDNISNGIITISGNLDINGDALTGNGNLTNTGNTKIEGIARITNGIVNSGTLAFNSAPLIFLPDISNNFTANTSIGQLIYLDGITDYKFYEIQKMRVKCNDPGADTVTIVLSELVNNVLTQVDSFVITHDNYDSYFSLMDMFGVNSLHGCSIVITAEASANNYDIVCSYTLGYTRVVIVSGALS